MLLVGQVDITSGAHGWLVAHAGFARLPLVMKLERDNMILLLANKKVIVPCRDQSPMTPKVLHSYLFLRVDSYCIFSSLHYCHRTASLRIHCMKFKNWLYS